MEELPWRLLMSDKHEAFTRWDRWSVCGVDVDLQCVFLGFISWEMHWRWGFYLWKENTEVPAAVTDVIPLHAWYFRRPPKPLRPFWHPDVLQTLRWEWLPKQQLLLKEETEDGDDAIAVALQCRMFGLWKLSEGDPPPSQCLLLSNPVCFTTFSSVSLSLGTNGMLAAKTWLSEGGLSPHLAAFSKHVA